jgi:hypothetical protein
VSLFKKVFPFLLIVFVGIQFMPTTRNQNNEVLETDFPKLFLFQTIFKICSETHVMIATATIPIIPGAIRYSR